MNAQTVLEELQSKEELQAKLRLVIAQLGFIHIDGSSIFSFGRCYSVAVRIIPRPTKRDQLQAPPYTRTINLEVFPQLHPAKSTAAEIVGLLAATGCETGETLERRFSHLLPSATSQVGGYNKYSAPTQSQIIVAIHSTDRDSARSLSHALWVFIELWLRQGKPVQPRACTPKTKRQPGAGAGELMERHRNDSARDRI